MRCDRHEEPRPYGIGHDAQGIRKQFKNVEDWLRWYKRAPNVLVSMQFYPKARLEQMLVGLPEQLRALQEGSLSALLSTALKPPIAMGLAS